MQIDSRAGSQELVAPLRLEGLAVEETILPFGDVSILGRGPGGSPVLVGVEYKKLPDVIACVRSGRFAEQLRGMRDSYQVSWLLIEGSVSNVGHGQVMKYKTDGHRFRDCDNRMSYTEMVSWVITMSMCGGVQVWRTETQDETVMWLRGLNNWWTAKDWEEHRAHLDWYTPPIPHAPWQAPTLVQKVAAELPGVGAVKSGTIAEHFKSVREMACALPEEWTKIKGIGKPMAARIVGALDGRQDGR